MVRAVNESFLCLVRYQYWHQIEQGEFVEGTDHAEILLNSISSSFEKAQGGLTDFKTLCNLMGLQPSVKTSPFMNGSLNGTVPLVSKGTATSRLSVGTCATLAASANLNGGASAGRIESLKSIG